jgi:hypothetical protein
MVSQNNITTIITFKLTNFIVIVIYSLLLGLFCATIIIKYNRSHKLPRFISPD